MTLYKLLRLQSCVTHFEQILMGALLIGMTGNTSKSDPATPSCSLGPQGERSDTF